MRLLLAIFLSVVYLFAYDFVEVLNPNIHIIKSGYFKTDQNISATQAFDQFKNNRYEQLPQQAKSFGFDSDTYWFMFETVCDDIDRHYVLNTRNFVADSVVFYVFKDNKIISESKNGCLTKIDEREINTLPISFGLSKESGVITYIVKITSTNPHFSGFVFGDMSEVSREWNIVFGVSLLAFGVFIGLIIYNIVLYFSIRDIAYLYYCMYMIGVLLFNIVGIGYLPLIAPSLTPYTPSVVAIAVQIELIGLTLFTIVFLDLKRNNKALKNALLTLLGIEVVLSLAMPIGYGTSLYVFSLFALLVFLIYVGIRSYTDGFAPAMFYLIATGVGVALFIAFMAMTQGAITYSIWSINFANFAMIWDLVVFALALAYRIKMLREEKERAQSIIIQKAKFATIGETIGNVAHQWRQPLNEISSACVNIEAEIKFNGSISNEKLINRVQMIYSVLDRLSKTIDTFQNFFHKTIDSKFNLAQCIDAAITFTYASLERLNINIMASIQNSDIEIHGSEDEFFEVIVILINNAKDAISVNNIQNPSIKIIVETQKNSVIIKVKDNGGGISVGNIDKIFEPYYSTKSLNGMGIGLYTAKTVVESKMQGSISASNADGGAVLSMKLPLA